MAVGPNVRLRMSMASESWTFGEFKLTHFPSKIGPPWTTNLRTILRSFLFNGPHVTIVKSADTALCRLIAQCRSIVARRPSSGPTASDLTRMLGFRPAFPRKP